MPKSKASKTTECANKSTDREVERGQREPIPFIPYPKAMALLVQNFGSTPEELAAWVSMGPGSGGLAAFSKPRKNSKPQRVHFDVGMGEDYVSPMMACWFKAADVGTFKPTDRYITGKALLMRWAEIPNIRPAAYINAKIAESRLIDMHPTFGLTQASGLKDWYPPMEAGLFSLSSIVEVEAEDFGIIVNNGDKGGSINEESPPVGSPEWRSNNARAAAAARHGQKGGTRDKRAKLLDRWASGNFKSRSQCARVVSEELGMSVSTARRLLIGVPKTSRT